MAVRFYIRVKGYVQGVGFRYFVKQTANLYSLTGWVRNCNDGDVEMEVQGSDADVAAFMDAVKKGSRYSDVQEVQMHQLDVIRESSFRIGDWI